MGLDYRNPIFFCFCHCPVISSVLTKKNVAYVLQLHLTQNMQRKKQLLNTSTIIKNKSQIYNAW